MYLRRLKIHSLPGIEPGFTFEPESDKVNIVTGPNAIGKSSLVRALKYLLAGVDPKSDPPNLHLEADFLSGDVRWTVRRTGRQIAWMHDGEAATPPTLPGADQFGLYRLSMESLLADDDSDQALAEHLWRTVRGGFDLVGARVKSIGPLFARSEERQLRTVRTTLSRVRGEYENLRLQEAELPGLARRIEQAEDAGARRGRLKTTLELHQAILKRRERGAALEGFPAEMANLHGDEIERLDELEVNSKHLGEQLAEARRSVVASARELEKTGLEHARPDLEQVAQARKVLRRIEVDAIERDNARVAVARAEACLKSARAELGDGEAPPRLDADSLHRARKIIEPLGDLRAQRRELRQGLAMADHPPEQSEIDRLREGVDVLRRWLAARAAGGEDGLAGVRNMSRTAWWGTMTLTVLTALAAFLEGALWALGSSLAAIVILAVFSRIRHRAESLNAAPMDAAKRGFVETGLKSPPEWTESAVREHLRLNVESQLNRLLLQRERAEGAGKMRAELTRVESEIDELETERKALASELGIDPELSGAPFLRFIAVSEKWDAARTDHAGRVASLRALDARISEDAERIRSLLKPWRTADAPPLKDSTATAELGALSNAFDALDARLSKAKEAEGTIESARDKVESLEERMRNVESEQAGLFARAGLATGARAELAQRIDRLEAWRQADKALFLATSEENRLRGLISDDPDLVEAAKDDAVTGLEREFRDASDEAEKYTELIKAQQNIETLLKAARRSHKLEYAARAKDQAEEALKDKRDEALSCAATEVLLDEVESAFKSEREPDLLRRARQWFEQVTAHAFTLELRDTDRFVARDKKLGELRALNELSSGTRMQLLLALRLAWTEDRERGGESLPLFFDEALTTSDVDRFSVMARTISRLADAGRQIFYLSARHHEAALWKQATGTAPAMIDLAAVRLDSALADPDALRVETPPPLPPPDRLAAEEYAVRIRVHPVNPCVDAGGIHLFHLLRDDLNLLYRLLDTWRIGTLGQLESLLASDAARTAIFHRHIRRRLRQRSRTARTWTELWCQGRGKPVDRAVLDQCPAIAPVFLDRAAELAGKLDGDGNALVRALRAGKLKHFRNSKTDELEKWLADKGYVDDAPTLEREERRRMTLQRVVPPSRSDTDDVNRVVDWMESAVVS